MAWDYVRAPPSGGPPSYNAHPLCVAGLLSLLDGAIRAAQARRMLFEREEIARYRRDFYRWSGPSKSIVPAAFQPHWLRVFEREDEQRPIVPKLAFHQGLAACAGPVAPLP